MPTISVNAKEISQPQFIPPGSLVTVTPDAGASVVVEYTKDSGATVSSGLATWTVWAKGTVTSATSDMLNEPAYVRLSPTGGAATLSFDPTPNFSQKAPFTTDWGGAYNPANIAITGGVVGAATSIPGGRMSRRSVAEALSKGALIQAPTWQATTAYASQRIIRHSNGQLLLCVTAGTSGASEPTFNAAQPITDGTAVWWTLGRRSLLNADGYPVPTITASTTITGLTARPLWTNQGMFIAPSCPNFVNGAGGNSLQAWAFNDGGSTSQHGMGVGLRGYLKVIEFKTDAPKVAFGSWNSAGAQYRVYVDDYLIEEDPTPYVTGNPSYYIIDWTAKDGRKMRRYRVEMAGGDNCTGIAVDAQSVVVPPPLRGPKGVWLSDSYGGTVSTYSGRSVEYLSERVMKRLGMRYTRNLHIGSTGYLATGSGTGSPFYNALTVLQNNPQTDWDADLVICAHGINDQGAFPTAQIAAQAQLVWDLLRRQYPNAFLAMVGPWAAAKGPNADQIALDNALASQMAAWGDANAAFIRVCTDTAGSWVSGTGTSAALTGSGNSDFYTGADTVHPTYNGVAYLENRVVTAIDTALSARGL